MHNCLNVSLQAGSSVRNPVVPTVSLPEVSPMQPFKEMDLWDAFMVWEWPHLSIGCTSLSAYEALSLHSIS